MNLIAHLLFSGCFLMTGLLVVAQESQWTRDSVTHWYGADDYLYNGRPYQPEHSGASGHPYFLDDAWQTGTVFLKDLCFPDQQLKYDLVRQCLIILHQPEGRPPVQLVLSEKLVDSFRIGASVFTRLPLVDSSFSATGYVEIVYQGNLEVYRSFSSHFVANYSGTHPNGFFSQTDQEYYLRSPGSDSWDRFSSAKALFRNFPEYTKELRQLRREQHIPKKHLSADQLSQLLRICDE